MNDIYTVRNENIKGIFRDVENKMKEVFHTKLYCIILYGSYARNENTAESDIDILVLVNDEEKSLRRYEDIITDIMVDLSLEYGVVLSLYIQSVEEYKKQVKVLPFLMNIQKEGVKIYEQHDNRIG